jgi:hypothetical protein
VSEKYPVEFLFSKAYQQDVSHASSTLPQWSKPAGVVLDVPMNQANMAARSTSPLTQAALCAQTDTIAFIGTTHGGAATPGVNMCRWYTGWAARPYPCSLSLRSVTAGDGCVRCV